MATIKKLEPLRGNQGAVILVSVNKPISGDGGHFGRAADHLSTRRRLAAQPTG
jgi:hypothetical protein